MVKNEVWEPGFTLAAEHKKQLQEFLTFLGLSQTQKPKGLLGVCENFVICVQKLGYQYPLLPKGLDRYLPIAKRLIEGRLAHAITKNDPSLARGEGHDAGRYLSGLLSGDSSPYAALYYCGEEGTQVIICLQQCMLQGVFELRNKKQYLQSYHINTVCLHIRKLCNESYYDWAREQAIDEMNSPKKILMSLPEEFKKKCHLMLDILADEKVITKKNSGSMRRGAGNVKWRRYGFSAFGYGIYSSPQVMGDIDDKHQSSTIYHFRKVDKVSDEIFELGVDAFELGSGYEFLLQEDRSDLSPSARAMKNKMKEKGMIQRIERQNQFLPLSNNHLNEQDIVDLTSVINTFLKNEEDELAFFLLAMLLTASDISIVQKLVIFGENAAIALEGECSLGFSLRHNAWVKLAYSPTYLSNAIEDSTAVSRTLTENYTMLPEPHDKLRTLIINRLITNQGVCYSPSKIYTLKKRNSKKLIKQALRRKSPRLTVSRIERCLPLLVAEQYDSTIACYLFNHYLPASSARSFYTTLSSHYFQKIYAGVRKQLLTLLNDDLAEEPRYTSEYYSGARYCPTDEHITSVITNMQKRLKQLDRRVNNREITWVDFHNEFTAIAVYAQGFYSGIRSVIDPFVSVDKISEHYGIAIFSDKNDEKQSRTRTIPIHANLLTIAKAYRSHRQAIVAKLALNDAAYAITLMSSDSEETFFLDEGLTIRRCRPLELKKFLIHYTQLPLNSNRKFLRTKLIEAKLSTVLVDQLLGHAHRGEAIGHQFSMLSFGQSTDNLMSALDTVLSETELPKLVKNLKGFSL